MANRLKLDSILRNILGTGNVYYQPPESIKMNYPCFVYELSANGNNLYADNIKFVKSTSYKVTYIDRNPDSDKPEIIEDLQYCKLTTSFATEGLNHWVYEIILPKSKTD